MPESDWKREFDRRLRAVHGIPEHENYTFDTDIQGADIGSGGYVTIDVEWKNQGRWNVREWSDLADLIRALDAVPPPEEPEPRP